jgi:hypothetical protein
MKVFKVTIGRKQIKEIVLVAETWQAARSILEDHHEYVTENWGILEDEELGLGLHEILPR